MSDSEKTKWKTLNDGVQRFNREGERLFVITGEDDQVGGVVLESSIIGIGSYCMTSGDEILEYGIHLHLSNGNEVSCPCMDFDDVLEKLGWLDENNH